MAFFRRGRPVEGAIAQKRPEGFAADRKVGGKAIAWMKYNDKNDGMR